MGLGDGQDWGVSCGHLLSGPGICNQYVCAHIVMLPGVAGSGKGVVPGNCLSCDLWDLGRDGTGVLSAEVGLRGGAGGLAGVS